jgi:hypothetical protein
MTKGNGVNFELDELLHPAQAFKQRIPTIVTTRSDASRPPVPIDRDQCDGAVRCIC